MKEWMEISASGPALRSDEAAYELLKAGSPGVVEGNPDSCDASNTKSKEAGSGGVGTLLSVSPDSFDFYNDSPEPDTEVFLTGHLDPVQPGAQEPQVRLRRLADKLKRLGWSFESAKYKDRDWSKSWCKSLRPIRVSNGETAIVVRATWSGRLRRPGEIELLIDPSMAFGTGHHATTKLCLKALLRLLTGHGKEVNGLKLLDVGTGTGVLAIAAKKLGIGSALGIEIDTVSLKIARKTVRVNGVDVKLSARAVEKHKGLYSIIVANILSGELIRLAPVLIDRLETDGTLLLSGILGIEADSVVDVYKGLGLKFVKRYKAGEWVALQFEKKL